MSNRQRHTLNQKVYQQLRRKLLRGDLAPDSQLDERQLAEELGVSRTPLREAISQLVKEGIVEHRPYRGNFVRTFTAKQVNDLYEVRKALESLAMRLAIRKLSQEHLEEIRTILDQVQEALDRGDITAYTEADRRFHQAILQITGNETLIESLNRLAAQIQMVRILANRDPEVVERTAQERPRILAALEARDADTAARLMEEHIDGVRRSIVAQLEALEQKEHELAREWT
ncbi:MAG: GntR family transcriptional regulator [Chloroflexi bacterium]|nr:MAG: GntR family transcriptional regulator [Chloroflexota bacterium]